MDIAIIVIVSLVILFILFSFFSAYFLCRYYARPRRRTHEEEKDRYRKMGLLYEYDDNPEFEEFILTLRDGVKVHGRFFEFNKGSNKFVILAHGFTVSQISMSKYMQAYKESGYNIITYDERGQSENDKAICGMSYFEDKDLVEVVNYVRDRFGKNIIVGVHGESMGAASVVGSLKYNPNINFAVADCPFARLKLLSIKEATIRYHAPRYLVDLCGPVGKLFFGYNPNKVDPIEGINNSNVPLLLCHGLNDNLIPYEHSQMIYDSYNGPKDIYFTEGADHAQGVFVNREAYNKKIKEFIARIEK